MQRKYAVLEKNPQTILGVKPRNYSAYIPKSPEDVSNVKSEGDWKAFSLNGYRGGSSGLIFSWSQHTTKKFSPFAGTNIIGNPMGSNWIYNGGYELYLEDYL